MALPNGKKLKYTLSGHLQFWLTIILMGHAIPSIMEIAPNSQIYVIKGFSPLKLSLLYDNYVQLISISTLGAFILSFYLYSSSFRGKDKIMAKGGDTGNAIYDFFIGDYAYSLFLIYVCIRCRLELIPPGGVTCGNVASLRIQYNALTSFLSSIPILLLSSDYYCNYSSEHYLC